VSSGDRYDVIVHQIISVSSAIEMLHENKSRYRLLTKSIDRDSTSFVNCLEVVIEAHWLIQTVLLPLLSIFFIHGEKLQRKIKKG